MDSNQKKSVLEIAEIGKMIASISRILDTVPFNTEEARAKIDEVNVKHPENVGIYNLLFYTQNGTGISICSANSILPYYIENVMVNPLASDGYTRLIKNMCKYFGIRFGGRSKVYEFGIKQLDKEWNLNVY